MASFSTTKGSRNDAELRFTSIFSTMRKPGFESATGADEGKSEIFQSSPAHLGARFANWLEVVILEAYRRRMTASCQLLSAVATAGEPVGVTA